MAVLVGAPGGWAGPVWGALLTPQTTRAKADDSVVFLHHGISRVKGKLSGPGRDSVSVSVGLWECETPGA